VNVNEIIESGRLEEYVLGILPDKEAEEITRLCAAHPEIKAAVESIEHTLMASFSTPVNPDWKQDILGSIQDDSVKTESPKSEPVIVPITSAPPIQSKKWFWAAASFAGLLVLSAAANIMLLTQNQSLGRELTDVKVKLQAETEEKAVFAASLQESQQNYSRLFDTEFTRIEMAGTPAFKEQNSTLFWNGKTGEVIWDGTSLPELSADKQYQLWAIVDGKPVSGGVFNADNPARMADAFAAQAFAVTIEPAGGSESPSLDQMVVLGAVSTI